MESVLAFSRVVGPPEVILLIIIGSIKLLFIFSYWRIFSKAGYSWAFGLLMGLPMSELVIPLILALIDWPVCKELRLFKQEQSSGSK